jgi:hypothetical protein
VPVVCAFFYPAQAVVLRQLVFIRLQETQFKGIATLQPLHWTDANDIDALRRRHECTNDITRARRMNTKPFKRIMVQPML